MRSKCSIARAFLLFVAVSVGAVSCKGRLDDAKSERLDANRFSLVDGKPHLLVFSAGWCMPCREEVDELNTLFDDYGSRLGFVSYLVEGSKKFSLPTADDVSAFRSLTNARPRFLVTPDPEWSRYSEVNITGERALPFMAFVDSKGQVRWRIDLGKNLEMNLRETIEKFLADESSEIDPTGGNKPVEPKEPDPEPVPGPEPSPVPPSEPSPGEPVPTPSNSPAPSGPVVPRTLLVSVWLVDPAIAPDEATRARFEASWRMGREKYQWSEEEMPFPAGKLALTVQATEALPNIVLKVGTWRSETCELKVYVEPDGTFRDAKGVCFGGG